MKLCSLCKSEEHFAARCPMRSKGTSPPQLYNSGGGGGSHGWAQHGLGAASSGGYSSMFVDNHHTSEGQTEVTSPGRASCGANETPYFMIFSQSDDAGRGTHSESHSSQGTHGHASFATGSNYSASGRPHSADARQDYPQEEEEDVSHNGYIPTVTLTNSRRPLAPRHSG